MSSPFFSIIIPSFNYGQFIGQTIQSLQKQSFADWECIIIDDESSDNTGEVVSEIAKHDSRILYYYQKNTGQAGARNKGLQIASGKYIQLLDADDYLETDKLNHFYQYLVLNPETDLLYGEGRLFIENDIKKLRLNYFGLEDKQWTLDKSGSGDEIVTEFIEFNRFLVNMPIVKATLARQLQMDHNNQGNEDWDFWMRAAISGAIFRFIPSLGNDKSLLRIHENSFSKREIPMFRSRIHMRENWQQLLKSDKLSKINNSKLQSARLVLGILYKNEHQDKLAVQSIFKAIWPIYSLKRSLFALMALLLSGPQAMKLLKKITGQV